MNLTSPCIASCKLNDEEICLGCKRTIDEIVKWRTYTDNQKLAVIARLESIRKDTTSQ